MTAFYERYCCHTELKTFTVTILHNCNKCKYCKATVTFYDKSKSYSEFQGIDMNAIDSTGKRRFYGIISYFSYLSPIFYPSSKMKSKQGSGDGSDEVEERPDLRSSVVSYYQLANQFTHRMLVAQLKNEKLKREEAKASSENDSTYSSDSCEKTVEKNSPKRSTSSSIFTEVVLKAKYKTNEKGKNDTKQAASGTLKRKRGNLERLKSQNDYEDDLYESQSLYVINVVEDDPISSDDCNIKTPELDLSVSPPEWNESSNFEDCISPADLRNFRKEAEEYQYRRSKRRKYMNVCTKMEGDSSSEVEAEKDSVYNTLVATREKLGLLKSECNVDSNDNDDNFEENEEIVDDNEDDEAEDEEIVEDDEAEDEEIDDNEDDEAEDEEIVDDNEDDEEEKTLDKEEEEDNLDEMEEENVDDNEEEKFNVD